MLEPHHCLVSYPEHSLGKSYPFAVVHSVYSTAPADGVRKMVGWKKFKESYLSVGKVHKNIKELYSTLDSCNSFKRRVYQILHHDFQIFHTSSESEKNKWQSNK